MGTAIVDPIGSLILAGVLGDAEKKSPNHRPGSGTALMTKKECEKGII